MTLFQLTELILKTSFVKNRLLLCFLSIKFECQCWQINLDLLKFHDKRSQNANRENPLCLTIPIPMLLDQHKFDKKDLIFNKNYFLLKTEDGQNY